MADLRRLHPRLTETDLDTMPFVPELSPVVNPHGDGLATRPWLDWARRLTLLVGVKTGGGGGTGTGDVVGPNGATPDAIAIYSGTTGKLIKDSLTSIGSVISQAVSQAIAAILPGGKLPLTNLPLHKTTHQTGGTDAVDVKLLAGYPGNNAQYLNGVGAFATPPGSDLDYLGTYAPATYNDGDIVVGVDGIAYMCVKDGTTTPPEAWPGGAPILAAHHVTHQVGGTDVVDVKLLGGYPGGTTNFLRADGAFAAPTAGIAAHHTTHEPGGADALVNAAWTTVANVFTTQPQTLSHATLPELRFSETGQPVDQRTFRIVGTSKTWLLQTISDAGVAQINALQIDRNGGGTFGGYLTCNASTGTSNTGNVACKDQPNVFTKPQKISDATSPALITNETGQPVNARQWRIVGASGALYIQTADDANVGQINAFSLTRTGQVRVANDIFERGRAYPLLGWQNGDLSTFTQTAGVSGAFAWAFGGNYLFINGQAVITLGTAQSFVRINLPSGAAPAIAYVAPISCYLGTVAQWAGGWVNFTGTTYMDLQPNNSAAWPVGTSYCGFSLQVPIQPGV